MIKPLGKLIIGLLFLAAVPSVQAQAEFELQDMETNQVKLSDYKGKVVWLDFWASWCVPCRASFPWMNTMQQRYGKQGFDVVTINLDKKQSEVNRFLKQYPAHFKVLLDPKGKTASAFKVKGMPSSYLINQQGQIVKSHLGFRQDKTHDYESEIRALISHE